VDACHAMPCHAMLLGHSCDKRTSCNFVQFFYGIEYVVCGCGCGCVYLLSIYPCIMSNVSLR
jgi:hypothetical protein